jgi:hypothetical protein
MNDSLENSSDLSEVFTIHIPPLIIIINKYTHIMNLNTVQNHLFIFHTL